MPALAAPLIGFVLGVAFAWAAADELAKAGGAAAGTRSLLLVSIFGFLVFGPAAGYFLAYSPDWSFAYLLDPLRMPAIADILLVILDVASCPIGFLVAARRASERRLGLLVQIAILPSLVIFVSLMIAFPRLSIEATYAQFHGDFGTHPVAGTRLGVSLLWMAVVLVAGASWTFFSLRKLAGGSRRETNTERPPAAPMQLSLRSRRMSSHPR